MQKARRHPPERGLRLLVSTRFQDLFHSPSGVLFTFPSRYWFTIGHQEVFSLGRWSSQLPTGFLVSRRTQDPLGCGDGFGYRAVTFCGWPFQAASPTSHATLMGVLQPRIEDRRFGLFPFRSPLLRESHLLSLPPGTEMFQFPGCAFPTLCIQSHECHPFADGGLPHSEISRIKAYLQLPGHIGVRPVLHRLLVPRHPPCALHSLTYEMLVLLTFLSLSSSQGTT